MWPLSSADLNLMKFAMLSIMESDVKPGKHSNTPVLLYVLDTVWSDFSEETMWRSFRVVMRHMKDVVRAKGGELES